MKKFLVLSFLLVTGMCAYGVDWKQIETNIPNFNLYIDNDSLKYTSTDEYLYAIKYQVLGKPEKIAYLKSNTKTHYIGVIAAGDYSSDTYRPKSVLANPHVFMKPIRNESFLSFAHSYVSSLQDNSVKAACNEVKKTDVIKKEKVSQVKADVKKENKKLLPEVSNVETKVSKDTKKQENKVVKVEEKKVSEDIKIRPKQENVVDVAFKTPLVQKDLGVETIKEYISAVRSDLDKNWTPPKSGRKTQSIVIINVGSDGSLKSYKFAQSSGDIATDRSILSAIEKSVPFAKFPKLGKPVNNLNFQFIFEYGKFKKSVI